MVLRLLSAIAYTAGETFVWYRFLPAKYEKKVTLSALILLQFCISIQGEFFAVEQISTYLLLFAEIVVQFFLFRGNLSRTHLMVFMGGLLSGVVSIVYGGAVGGIYRLIIGKNEPLWISGENLNIIGLLLTIPYILLWILLCSWFLPKVQKTLREWPLRRCKIIFGILLILEVFMSTGFGIENESNMQEYNEFYIATFLLLLLLAAILGGYLFKAIHKNVWQNCMQEQELEGQYQKYKELEELQQNLRELRHDLKNYLAAGAGGGYIRKRFFTTVKKYRKNWRRSNELYNAQNIIHDLYDCNTGIAGICCP